MGLGRVMVAVAGVAGSGRWRGLVAAGLCMAAAGAAVAEPSDTVFTVGNYPVEASAANAVAAKERALADGQQAAFRSLLKRLVPVTSYAQAMRLMNTKAANLVDGYKVRAERNSSTDYIANLDFSFDPHAVRELLRREGIPFVDEQAAPVIVVPIWKPGATGGKPGPDNTQVWANAWKGLDLEHALVPLRIEALRKEISLESLAALTGGDMAANRMLALEYKADLVVLAVAEPEGRKLKVTLAGQDGVGRLALQRSYRLDDTAYAAELAAVVSHGILEGRWKATQGRGGAGGGPGGGEMRIAVEFRGIGEWQDISRRLSRTPGVQDVDVAGLSARSARVSLRYPGGPERLAAALAQQGLNLRNVSGSWVLQAP